MLTALYAKAVDAYCTGEPFRRRRPACLKLRAPPVHDARRMAQLHLLRADRARRADQHQPPAGAGPGEPRAGGLSNWLDATPANRARAVAVASGRKYFNQDPNVLKFVMENPADRVTYGDLRMIRPEFDELMKLSIEAGTLKRPVAYESYVDESFVKNIKPVSIAL
ncbi:hypothetical protein LP420_26945 [Massilia sp. B-10]|nr:hypothetical protein LP420_26945 [Massilia sp. B-10]